MGKWINDKVERAKSFILAHPDLSKQRQAEMAGVSTSTIAEARRQLVDEGKLPPSRKSQGAPSPTTPTPAKPPGPASGSDQAVAAPQVPLRDHDAMEALARMTDLGNLDDEEVRRRMHRMCVQFMFDPKLHPDTRMSASQMWEKLKDRAKVKDLGPGSPMTYEDGVSRLSDMMRAAGPKMTLAAVDRAFEVRRADGEAADEQAPAAGGTAEAPVAT